MRVAQINEFRGKYAGVYIISPVAPGAEKIAYLVGRSIQMGKRMNDYHLCFPDGFYMYKALLLNDTFKTRGNIDKQIALDMTKQIEKYIHEELESVRFESITRGKNEWFVPPDEKYLNEVLIKTHKKFIRETDYPITKFKYPFYNKFWIDNAEHRFT